jgi:hypothetical protein
MSSVDNTEGYFEQIFQSEGDKFLHFFESGFFTMKTLRLEENFFLISSQIHR